MHDVLKFDTDPGIDRVSLDQVDVGQYHLLNAADGGFEAQRIFEVIRDRGALTIRMGDPARSVRRDFGAGKLVDILRDQGRSN